jgi:ferredoxin
MNLMAALLLCPAIVLWVISGALSLWCLPPLLAAPLAAFLLRSANPPALGSLVWLKGALAGLAALPAVWHPQPHADFWHFSPAFLLAGTGAALGGALASARPGLLKSPLAPAAILATLLPLAAAWLAGPAGLEPPAPADIPIFAAPAERGAAAPGPGAVAAGLPSGQGRGGAERGPAADTAGAPAGDYGPEDASGTGYGTGPSGTGRVPDLPAVAGDPAGTELAAVLALAPLFLFLMAAGEAPRLPAAVFLAGLAALAMLKGSLDWGAGVFWTFAAFMVLPELLRGPRGPLLGILLWAPAACEVAASYGWTSRGADVARLGALGWFVVLGMLSTWMKTRELRRLQTAAVRAVLLAHPLSLKSFPGGAAGAPGCGGRDSSRAVRAAPARAPAPMTAAVMCRRPRGMPRADTPPGLTCAVLNSMTGGPWACREGCIGAGDCAASCPSAALEMPGDGAPPVTLPDRCSGCGLCALACPKGLVKLVPAAWKAVVPCRGSMTMKAMDALCESGCLGCGLCRKACHKDALAWTPPFCAAAQHSHGHPAAPPKHGGPPRGPRGGAKPAVNQGLCLDPESGDCGFECLMNCPRDVVRIRRTP